MKKRTRSFLIILIAGLLSACTGSATGNTRYQSDDELIVLAHGLGRSDIAMWRLTQRLESAGYLVCTLDYSTVGESVDSVLKSTTEQIDTCIAPAPRVHFVGHSLGGLVIRSYLQNDRSLYTTGRLGEVVLMGTPNKGSELADHYKESWLMEVGGEISRALVTGENSLGSRLEQPYFHAGIIAGTKSTGMTRSLFPGPNDGLVSVESAKLENMSDFIEIEVSHTNMRYSREVASQTLHFLRHGRFDHISD